MTDPMPPDDAVAADPLQATAPAGWYPVAAGSPQQRYWDGAAWTEHIHDPGVPAQTVAGSGVIPKAPEGTRPNTVWFWITAFSPILAILGLIPTAIYFSQLGHISGNYTAAIAKATGSPAYPLSTLLGFIEIAAYILFPILDWRVLRQRGVPKPFHWAFSLAAIFVSSPIVYVIGRTVVVRRRTGSGLTPLWIFVGLQVIAWIIEIVVVAGFIAVLVTQYGHLVSGAS